MSLQANNSVVVNFLYADGTNRAYTFENVADDDLGDVKDKIRAINANSNNEYANFYQTFVSDDGAAFVKIESAKIISVMEEEIYSG